MASEIVNGVEFPSADDVATVLARIKRDIDDVCDVRLQVYEDGAWMVRYGISDYDLDHRGFWGASSIDPDDEADTLASVAGELIDQAADACAMAAE